MGMKRSKECCGFRWKNVTEGLVLKEFVLHEIQDCFGLLVIGSRGALWLLLINVYWIETSNFL